MANQPKKNASGSRAHEKEATAAKREARREKAAAQAARMKAEAAARQRRDRLAVGGVVAVVLALIAGGVWFQLSRTSGPVEPPANVSAEYGFSVGKDDAPTEIEIMADYLCPVCAQFEQQTDAPLTAAVEAGKVKLTHLPVVILGRYGDYSERAANAVAVVLDTAGPEVAAEFNRNLFAEQPAEGGEQPGDDWLIDLAVESGADKSKIEDGIKDNKFERWVKEGTQEAQRRGMQGTPTIFIDGKMVEYEAAVQQIAAL